MDETMLRDACVRLMERAKAAYLTSIDPDGYPHTRAMLNLRNTKQYPHTTHLYAQHRENMLVYFTTNTSSGKVRELTSNPRVSVYYCDPTRFHGVMLAGDIEIMNDASLRHALWAKGWERYYPGGPDDPDHTILRLFPALVTGWYKASPFAFRPKTR